MSDNNFVYVAYSKSFPNSVKIGCSSNVERRMKEIAGQTPSEFVPVLSYKVNGRYKDHKIHSIIKRLNPTIKVKGENYYISPAQAINLFKNIAEMSGTEENLFIYKTDFRKKHYFSFGSCGIPSGSILKFVNNKSICAKVLDDRYIEYNGKQTTLSVLATKLIGSKKIVKGENYFTFNNRILSSYC